MLQRQDIPGTQLAVTWVEVAPGARQLPHAHPQEQVYVIVAGQGVMEGAGDEQKVTPGDLVHIPPDTLHGIRNEDQELLIYVSAATPSLDIAAVYDHGHLQAHYYAAPENGGAS